ncbi:conserved exported hypothetical protein [Bradyrhizobium sp. STM 3843]|uniref:curli assembly protein CsgF n=1 Tax=unclassified Bradyrhizobium TaxID=2631580 RepID=UPI0002407137|nr:curli assembly protein CsgF [Bradyrhizobium sp. STM 3843]CCE06469.1 conserved exported hypothetical protein [Bradyrhizobium sp. STM 3843]
MRKFGLALFAIASAYAAAGAAAVASEIVYHPVNPTFGGSPLNGSFLLSQAQAQGEGVKSGSQGPDLSGLNNALSNLNGPAIIVNPTPSGSSPAPTSAVRSLVP